MRYQRNRQRRRAAEYVLDDLDAAATRGTASLGEDPEFAGEIMSIGAIAKLLSEVPAEAWQPIPAPGQEPAPANRRHWRPPTRSRALAAAVAVTFLAIGFAAGALINRSTGGSAASRPSQAATATLRPLPGQPAAAVGGVQLASGGRIVISFRRLPNPGAGRFYEAWLMTSTTKLIAVASFRPDAHGSARVETSLPSPVRAFRYIDVSLQQAGASPAHSGDSVLRGPTAPLAQGG